MFPETSKHARASRVACRAASSFPASSSSIPAVSILEARHSSSSEGNHSSACLGAEGQHLTEFGPVAFCLPVVLSHLQRYLKECPGRRRASIPGEQEYHRIGQTKRRVRLQHLLWQLLYPAMQRVQYLIQVLRLNKAFDEHSSACKVQGVECDFDRFSEQPMLFVPETRLVVQRAQVVFSQATPRLVLHGLGKQRVIAIPAPGPIERNQEQVGTFQLLENALTIVPSGDCVTERPR